MTSGQQPPGTPLSPPSLAPCIDRASKDASIRLLMEQRALLSAAVEASALGVSPSSGDDGGGMDAWMATRALEQNLAAEMRAHHVRVSKP
jgi:hypothetical protein